MGREELIALRRIRILAASVVALATISLYSATLGHKFVNWDDDAYVYANPTVQSLSPRAVARLFSSFYYYAYIPVTMLSHAADVAMWGMKPRGHHLTNVLLHTANAVWVLFLGLALIASRRGTRARPGAPGPATRHEVAAAIGMSVAAVLFSVHPLRAESVSWVSDRKDLLCAFVFLPGVLAYLQHASRRGTSGARPWYVASFVLFLLASLSKLIATMFPAVLLLLDWLWLERPPHHAKALYNYAIVLDQLGRHEEAIPAMIRAARIGSKDAQEALTSRGLAW